MKKDEIESLIEKTNALFRIANGNTKLIAFEAQKYIDWTNDIICKYSGGNKLVIEIELEFVYEVFADTFFSYAFEHGKVTEEDFISLHYLCDEL